MVKEEKLILKDSQKEKLRICKFYFQIYRDVTELLSDFSKKKKSIKRKLKALINKKALTNLIDF